MERIVDDLKEKGSDREWCIRAQRRLQEGKLITESTAPRTAHLAKITAENLL